MLKDTLRLNYLTNLYTKGIKRSVKVLATIHTQTSLSDLFQKCFVGHKLWAVPQWSRKPKNVQKFRITLFWHVVGLRDVNFTKM